MNPCFALKPCQLVLLAIWVLAMQQRVQHGSLYLYIYAQFQYVSVLVNKKKSLKGLNTAESGLPLAVECAINRCDLLKLASETISFSLEAQLQLAFVLPLTSLEVSHWPTLTVRLKMSFFEA